MKKLVELGKSPEDCWNWQGSVNKTTGYGKKQLNGDTLLAHRWLYQTLFGPIPDSLVVDHICGNRICVNPHHLRLVSQAENCRSGAGTTLTADDVSEIRKLLRNGAKRGAQSELARRYGVTPATISDIKSGRSWN